MAWKVFFDDQTTFDNTQGAVAAIPNKGIVAVAVTGSPGEVFKDYDWYVYGSTIGFRAISLQQLLYQITNYAGVVTLVRQGAMVPNSTYNTIIAAANTFAGL